MVGAVGRLDQFPKDVIEPLVLEVALLLGNPFLQPEMGLDDEFLLCHGVVLRLGFAVSVAQFGCDVDWARVPR